MEISIEKLVGSVMKLGLGRQLDEAIAREVFQMKKSSMEQMVINPFTGKEGGMSPWIGADGKTPLHLPMFSTVPFVATLMLADFQKAVKIERTVGDESKGEAVYFVAFSEDEGSGIALEGKTFAEAVARATLFEARFRKECDAAIERVFNAE